MTIKTERTFDLICGDVIESLKLIPDNTFKACFCDPPYGLKFMGKRWDHGVPGVGYWKEVLRVLKPGAPILAFGGSRTYHRLAVAIEDAGFEIFDSILGSVWITGQGFPKSLAIDKAIDKHLGRTGAYGEPKSAAHAGWIDRGRMRGDQGHEGFQRPWMQDEAAVDRAARQYIAATPEAAAWKGYSTHLKPSWEPVVCARKPLSGTYAENCIEHGCGGLNIDGSRIGTGHDRTQGGATGKRISRDEGYGGAWADAENGRERPLGGRYPANLILSHHPECKDADGCHPECPVSALDRQSGERRSPAPYVRKSGSNKQGVYSPIRSRDGEINQSYGDSGGASRFFYCSKVSTAERNAGLSAGCANGHATLKPLALTTYLAKLILPPPHVSSRLLVPFCGTGSEMAGALIAGWGHVVGIDNDPESITTAQSRIPALCEGSFSNKKKIFEVRSLPQAPALDPFD